MDQVTDAVPRLLTLSADASLRGLLGYVARPGRVRGADGGAAEWSGGGVSPDLEPLSRTTPAAVEMHPLINLRPAGGLLLHAARPSRQQPVYAQQP